MSVKPPPMPRQRMSRETAAVPYDVAAIREDFPILGQLIHGRPLAYLDNAATSQKPRAVLDTLSRYYETINANVHRGFHLLSERATKEYEDARVTVGRFLNAASHEEIVFTRGTTEAINLVAATFGRRALRAGDEILVSAIEHHSNIVPWQMLCEQTGANLRVIPVDDRGELELDVYERLLTPRTRLLAIMHVSNVLGTINPLRDMIGMARARDIAVVVDGAQAVPHQKVDVRELDCDFYAFSGHKLYGPTGIGALYGKKAHLDAMPPYQGGGDMISSVTFEKTTYNTAPYKFEAGTPHIAGAIGLAAAIDYVEGIGLERIQQHESDLLGYATEEMLQVPGLRILGTAREKAAVISFTIEGLHPVDIGTILDGEGVAVRTGHHCCQPLMDRFQLPAATRASFGLYNTRQEVDALVRGLHKVREVLG